MLSIRRTCAAIGRGLEVLIVGLATKKHVQSTLHSEYLATLLTALGSGLNRSAEGVAGHLTKSRPDLDRVEVDFKFSKCHQKGAGTPLFHPKCYFPKGICHGWAYPKSNNRTSGGVGPEQPG